MGIAKQGGPWRIQFSLTENSTFSYCLFQISPRRVWGRSAAQSRGIDAVGRQSEGSAQRSAGGQDTLVSLTGCSRQLGVLCVCLYSKTFGC